MLQNSLYAILAPSLVLFISIVAGLESENIIGGRLADIRDSKYVVSLQDISSHLCGGTLIASDVILTAAHCFYDKKGKVYQDKPYYVIAGTTNIKDHTYRERVTKIYLHKQFGVKWFSNKVLNDIAVAKLEKGFKVHNHPYIGIASLPEKYDEFVGQSARVTGFGFEGFLLGTKKTAIWSGNLKKESVNIVSAKNCGTEKYPSLLCGQMKQSSETYQGLCDGDSGSPLTIMDKVIGIASAIFTKDCNESQVPATYTKVSMFLDFIGNAMHNIQGQDILVKSTTNADFHSPGHQLALGDIQKYFPKFEDAKKKRDQLKKLVEELEKELRNLKKMAQKSKAHSEMYRAKFEQYKDKHNEYNAQLRKVDEYKALLDKAKADSKAWEKKEKDYGKKVSIILRHNK